MRDRWRIAGGIAVGFGLATLPFLHARWGLAHDHRETGVTNHHAQVSDRDGAQADPASVVRDPGTARPHDHD